MLQMDRLDQYKEHCNGVTPGITVRVLFPPRLAFYDRFNSTIFFISQVPTFLYNS